MIRGGIAAYKDYQMRRNVVFGGRVDLEFESPAMNNTMRAVSEPPGASDSVNASLPAGAAASKALPQSVDALEVSRLPMTFGEYRAPVRGIDGVKTGVDFSLFDSMMGAAIKADHANKFVPWAYGKALQIGGRFVEGAGLVMRSPLVERAGGMLNSIGEKLTPLDHVK